VTTFPTPKLENRPSALIVELRARLATVENRTASFQPLGRATVTDAAYAAAGGDTLIAYTSITAARAVTILAASTMPGRQITVKDESGSCSGTNTITVAPASGTIDGAASKVISTAYGTLKVYSNGTNWFTW
jgi:hypothetical protein